MPRMITTLILTLIGLFIFLVAFIAAIDDITYIETTAVVVDVRYNENSETYYPIYEYEFNGQTVRAEGFPTLDREDIIIGSEKTINYNPKNYKKFNEGSRQGGTFLLVFSILILACTIPEFIIFIRMLKLFRVNKVKN